MLEIHLVVPFRVLRAASTYLRETAKREIAAGKQVMRKVVNITSIAGYRRQFLRASSTAQVLMPSSTR